MMVSNAIGINVIHVFTIGIKPEYRALGCVYLEPEGYDGILQVTHHYKLSSWIINSKSMINMRDVNNVKDFNYF